MRARVERAGYWQRMRNGYFWLRWERASHMPRPVALLKALWHAWATRNEWEDRS